MFTVTQCECRVVKDYVFDMFLFNRFTQKQPPWAWLATKSSVVTLVIASLIGYMVHAASKRTAKVEEDYRELKRRAEDAAVAKSQVISFIADNSNMCYCCCS
jgi:hypothetical protein